LRQFRKFERFFLKIWGRLARNAIFCPGGKILGDFLGEASRDFAFLRKTPTVSQKTPKENFFGESFAKLRAFFRKRETSRAKRPFLGHT